jgi:hypothetical protein
MIHSSIIIQQIAHAGFDPFGIGQHFPCDSNFEFIIINNILKIIRKSCVINLLRYIFI